MNLKRQAWAVVFLMLILFIACPTAANPQDIVYVIPVSDTIDPGLAKFIDRSYREAEAVNADMVILEIDTPGGRVDAALDIRNTIRNSIIPTSSLVTGRAISAGSFIAIASRTIGMVPGSTIGDAEPRIGKERADEKTLSSWRGEMAAVAEANGRDPQIAMAMADRDIEIPGLVEKGKLLTLTYNKAKELGYTDYVVKDRKEFLEVLGYQNAQVIEAKLSAAERATRIVTNPYVAPLLLTVGIAGIVIEVLTIGWGIAGSVGIVSLILYFGGHLLAGFTGWEVILLFILGLILLGIEALMPGFGIAGIGGIGCILASIILVAPSWEAGVISLVLALVGTIVLVLLSFKFLTKRKFWSRFILNLKFNKEEGYVAQGEDLSKYLGQKGVAYTPLRPAGGVLLDSGRRLDVVTVGEYIMRGERVEICMVEGSRIIVRSVDQPE